MAAVLELFEMVAPDSHAGVGEIDRATLARCRLRDPAALRQFVLRYQPHVFAFLSRALGRGPHVEDLAQEVFLRASQALGRFDPDGPARLSTWLLTIAARVAADARKKRKLPLVPPQLGLGVADPATPETEARRRELAGALELAARQLPDDQLDAFVLAEFHDLSMAEIAQVLGVPENTAKTRLFRARERLRALLVESVED
jgi:RNA polymerase sigma-70 factor (ECF subfamily)